MRNVYRSPLGPLQIVTDERWLLALRLPGRGGGAAPCHGPVLAATRAALDAYFAGRFARPELPFAWHVLPPFQRLVLETLWREVPAGETVSYLELAQLSGSPRACRAVGTAMAKNPWPIVVPCHRVLATGGIGGYGGGLDRKRFLLAHEAEAAPVRAQRAAAVTSSWQASGRARASR